MAHHGFTRDGGSDEWYTPEYVLGWMGTSWADWFDPFPVYGVAGFDEAWGPKCCWVNPPYSVIGSAVSRSAVEPNWCFITWVRTEAPWAQDLLRISDAQFWPNERIRFIDGRIMVRDKKTKLLMENPNLMKPGGSPGSASVIFGRGEGVSRLRRAVAAGHGVMTYNGL